LDIVHWFFMSFPSSSGYSGFLNIPAGCSLFGFQSLK
jgi:hypothetical protein